MAKIFSLEDQLQDEIKRDEDAYFSAVGPERRAISIKLTIVSELNQSLVADNRLWRWIEVYLDKVTSFDATVDLITGCENQDFNQLSIVLIGGSAAVWCPWYL